LTHKKYLKVFRNTIGHRDSGFSASSCSKQALQDTSFKCYLPKETTQITAMIFRNLGASTIFANCKLHLLLKMETSDLLISHFLDKIYRNSDELNAKKSRLNWIGFEIMVDAPGYFSNKTKISQ
jgi:hypothetical protein